MQYSRHTTMGFATNKLFFFGKLAYQNIINKTTFSCSNWRLECKTVITVYSFPVYTENNPERGTYIA